MATNLLDAALWYAEHGKPVFPVWGVTDDGAPKADRYISGGRSIPNGWRCAICLEAVHVALALSPRDASL